MLSNQYPRLLWQRQEGIALSYVAYPHGPGAGWARVWFDHTRPKESRWAYVVQWPQRFRGEGGTDGKQLSADRATIVYWDRMNETEEWRAPPPPPERPPPSPEFLAFDAYLKSRYDHLTNAQLRSLALDYGHAARKGVTLAGSLDLDAHAARVVMDEYWRREWADGVAHQLALVRRSLG